MKKEIRRESLKGTRYRWICPECREGEMVWNGIELKSVVGNSHRCNKCGHVEMNVMEKYPRVELENDDVKT